MPQIEWIRKADDNNKSQNGPKQQKIHYYIKKKVKFKDKIY